MTPTAWNVLAWTVLVGLLAAIAVIDLRSQRIPNLLNGTLLLAGLGAAALPSGPGIASAVAGALLGGAVLFGIAWSFRRLRGIDGLGFGDVKFLVGAGAWTGWDGVGPVVFLAAVTALLWLAGRRLAGVALERHQPIPFGPPLCLALLAVRIAQVRAGEVTGTWM